MVGRPRKPDAIKKAQGTYQACRDTGIKIDLLDKMPDPDPKLRLSRQAKGLWYSYGNQLVYNGLMTFMDLMTFGRYCKLYDRSLQLESDIRKHGMFFKTQSGYEQIRPACGLLSTVEGEMLKIEDRFGLSPNSRAKIPAEKKMDDNPFLKLMDE